MFAMIRRAIHYRANRRALAHLDYILSHQG